MHPIIEKTFGGLSRAYYFRQLFFGALFGIFIGWISSQAKGPTGPHVALYAFIIINTLLYPYSRFVYYCIIGFIMGNNVFYVNALFMLLVKYFTMCLCWAFAIFVAPIGLAYLYWHHRRQPV